MSSASSSLLTTDRATRNNRWLYRRMSTSKSEVSPDRTRATTSRSAKPGAAGSLIFPRSEILDAKRLPRRRSSVAAGQDDHGARPRGQHRARRGLARQGGTARIGHVRQDADDLDGIAIAEEQAPRLHEAHPRLDGQ